jgi:hypothetical protein
MASPFQSHRRKRDREPQAVWNDVEDDEIIPGEDVFEEEWEEEPPAPVEPPRRRLVLNVAAADRLIRGTMTQAVASVASASLFSQKRRFFPTLDKTQKKKKNSFLFWGYEGANREKNSIGTGFVPRMGSRKPTAAADPDEDNDPPEVSSSPELEERPLKLSKPIPVKRKPHYDEEEEEEYDEEEYEDEEEEAAEYDDEEAEEALPRRSSFGELTQGATHWLGPSPKF